MVHKTDEEEVKSSIYLTEVPSDDVEIGEDFGIDPTNRFALDEDEDLKAADDPELNKIKVQISESLEKAESVSSIVSEESEEESNPVLSENFTTVTYGLQPRSTYEHGKKNTDIMGLVYNSRMRQFVILDTKGITTWKRDMVDVRIQRALLYPKYEYKLITYLIYAKKYNCYFALGKDFSLRVLNQYFDETCSVSGDLRSVLFMLFNPVEDELITGGVGGTKVWKFEKDNSRQLYKMKELANYTLRLKCEWDNVGGSWVKRVDLDQTLKHLYCCSDTDLHVYRLTDGQTLFKIERTHNMSITGCCYAPYYRALLTCSVDTTIKAWSLIDNPNDNKASCVKRLLHTFSGHSRAVTGMVLHPETQTMFITSSLDGTVRIWSLDTMEQLYSTTISTDGLLWMGLTDDNLLYISTCRSITLWHTNQFLKFWALARNNVNKLYLSGAEDKTTRVVAVCDDSSVKLFSRVNRKNLTTMLPVPPPDLLPLQKVLSVCYSREFTAIYILINPTKIWVYTARTDPCCKIGEINVLRMQHAEMKGNGQTNRTPKVAAVGKGPAHRATENGMGNEIASNCCSLSNLNSPAMMWTDEGFCSPIRHSYLLMGLEDGRILFTDPVIIGQKYMEFKASKDAISDMRQDENHNSLITLSRSKELMMVQIWTLPQLELCHELYCDVDITSYARINSSFLSGHESGHLNYYLLEPAEDPGLFKAKQEPKREDIIPKKQVEHRSKIVSVDGSLNVKIFCSCSDNGMIRIWDEFKVLLREICLDDEGATLSSACFLDNLANMLVAFKNHLYIIDHSKVCPQIRGTEDEDTFDKESHISEEQYVLYEGSIFHPEPVTLENYLVPFPDKKFTQDFLEGKVESDSDDEDGDSDTDSTLSFAPSDIYDSPILTPDSLSMWDLTMDSEVSKFDLLEHMKRTIKHLKQKERKKRRKQMMLAQQNGEVPDFNDNDEDEEKLKFEMPQFGNSPGPTPVQTPTGSRPTTPDETTEQEKTEQAIEKPKDELRTLEEIKAASPVPQRTYSMFDHLVPLRTIIQPKTIPRAEYELIRMPKTALPVYDKSIKTTPSDLTMDIQFEKAFEEIRETLAKSPKDPSIPDISINLPSPIKLDKFVEEIQWEEKQLQAGMSEGSSAQQQQQETQEQEASTTEKQEESKKAVEEPEDKTSKYNLKDVSLKDLSKGDKVVRKKKRPDSTRNKEADHDHKKEGSSDEEEELTEVQKKLKEHKLKEQKELRRKQMLERRMQQKKKGPTPEELLELKRQELLKQQSERMDIAPHLRPKPAPNMKPLDNQTSAEKLREDPMIKVDDQSMMESMEEQLWAMEAGVEPKQQGLMGTKLELPPLRKGTGALGIKAKYNPDRPRTMIGDRSKTPSMAPTPTRDLDRLDTPEPVQQLKPGEPDDYLDKSHKTVNETTRKLADGKEEDLPQVGDELDPRWLDRPRSRIDRSGAETPTAALRRLKDQKANSQPIKVILPRESDQQLEASRASPISEVEEGHAHQTIHDADDEYTDNEEFKQRLLKRGEKMEEQDETLLTEEEKGLAHQRPYSSFHRKKMLPVTGEERRPQTAFARFKAELEILLEIPENLEELQTAFDKAMDKFQKIPGTPHTVTKDKLLHRNNGLMFDENWPDREIERHLLLRMQKELRTRSALKKRQDWEDKLNEKRKLFTKRTFDNYSVAGTSTKSDSYILGQMQRANTSHMSLNTGQPTVTVRKRPQTAYAALQQFDKKELKAEKPFRYKIKKTPEVSRPPSRVLSPEPQPDIRMFDPRNPDAVRPTTVKSIPSKCQRYILVSRPKEKTNLPLPSPLEEQLLAERFPGLWMKVYQQHTELALKAKKVSYCVEYTPFSY
ncbi:uncharacterized protein LOC127730555 isoform X3 [Mytilus californianus]|uniref:uncharacterized protein LOC127730555 isoform X3 n=1 Tax=Mytilus californianus TaxID=6549 RepID=UPI0022464DE1|nr:uncharacterized protein LOC127730555 isoform X3 [Mytilus californianus]